MTHNCESFHFQDPEKDRWLMMVLHKHNFSRKPRVCILYNKPSDDSMINSTATSRSCLGGTTTMVPHCACHGLWKWSRTRWKLLCRGPCGEHRHRHDDDEDDGGQTEEPSQTVLSRRLISWSSWDTLMWKNSGGWTKPYTGLQKIIEYPQANAESSWQRAAGASGWHVPLLEDHGDSPGRKPPRFPL